MANKMKCVTVSAFGDEDDVLNVVDDYPKPELKPGSGLMLVRVQACSTTPGDWRTYSGKADVIRNPAFPYIPSQDVCGVVEEVDGDCKFKVGDCVIGTWSLKAFSDIPCGGMAEYALVDPKMAVIKPANLSAVEGAALANSSVHALLAMRKAHVKRGERVLVIGGSGGVGSSLIQIVKDVGASYVASVSTDEEMMKSLGVNRNVNYRKQAWWDIADFKANKFDVILDCAEGIKAWKNCKPVLKSGSKGGRFIAVGDIDPDMGLHHWHQLLGLLGSTLWRQSWTFILRPLTPSYSMFLGTPTGEVLAEVCKLAEAGRLKVILDPSSPFPFTTEGTRAAHRLQGSGRAHGKIVVQISE
eukprot:Plantae.Rhodophyta-Hildenbrandia_rubra.ctg11914.p1 GENE.Plantae.Rhodophyta-Hildenbrandia_rubra.ctg11914~~Plantae.Rhodophyta-Hildenbrandia_rubra.ctg11914.p1  ORF type:complete len:356 (+),score=55.24 Plantae.Rhodophyta-Hildenbrandia_rubra.ctg11914:296-1363(+)